MQVKTRVKAGGLVENHNETLVRVQKPTPGLTVKTKVKAGTIYKAPTGLLEMIIAADGGGCGGPRP